MMLKELMVFISQSYHRGSLALDLNKFYKTAAFNIRHGVIVHSLKQLELNAPKMQFVCLHD